MDVIVHCSYKSNLFQKGNIPMKVMIDDKNIFVELINASFHEHLGNITFLPN